MDDGSMVRGETNITASQQRIAELMLDPPDAAPLPETLEAIERADLITVGPGSLYTSLITNLLVQGIPAALAEARGVRVLHLQPDDAGQREPRAHAPRSISSASTSTPARRSSTTPLVNTAPFSPETLARYAAEHASPIEVRISSASKSSVSAASPATSPAKKMSCATPPVA